MASIFTTIGKASSLLSSVKGLVADGKKTTISNLVIDCVHSEEVNYSNTITEHPVESKQSVTDHVYRNPAVLQIEGTITDSTMKIWGVIEQPLQKNSLNSLMRNIKQVLHIDSSKLSDIAYKTLYDLYNNKQPLKVATKRKLFENMVIEKLDVTDDETTTNRLHFKCTMKQITFAQVKKTAYTRKANSLVDMVQKGLQPSNTETGGIARFLELGKKGARAVGRFISGAVKEDSNGESFIDNIHPF